MLDLALFAQSSAIRANLWHAPGSEEWSLADWSNATCGEAGELLEASLEVVKHMGLAANLVKKIRRVETATDLPPNHPPLNELLDDLGGEIADTITYALLLASKAGLDAERELVLKFNKVSRKMGWDKLIIDDTGAFVVNGQ
jgi:NTP pyrophosphatase (non-canonical NTP hydrolase)